MDENQPPGKDGAPSSSLEIENSGIEEFREREAALEREKATLIASQVMEHQERQRLAEKTMLEAGTARPDWLRIKWHLLRFLLFFLLSFFCLSAFFDFVNFMEGVRILAVGLKQLAVVTVFYWCAFTLRNRLSANQSARLGRWGKLAAKLAGVIAFSYICLEGAKGISGMLAQQTKNGLRWNRPFLYFLCVFATALAATFWMWKMHRRAARALADLEFGLGDESGLGPDRDQLRLVKYTTEGMALNLALMVFLQLAFNFDIPMILLHSLGRPAIFLFYFSPFFIYVFFRKFIEGFYL